MKPEVHWNSTDLFVLTEAHRQVAEAEAARLIADLYDRNPDAPGDWLAEHHEQILSAAKAYAYRLELEDRSQPPVTTDAGS